MKTDASRPLFVYMDSYALQDAYSGKIRQSTKMVNFRKKTKKKENFVKLFSGGKTQYFFMNNKADLPHMRMQLITTAL